MQGRGRRLQMPVQGMQLVPEGLRVGREAEARHLPHLACQGQVIGVLRDCHRDGEVHGVAAPGEELRRAERRLDARATPTRVLLALVAHDPEGALDDVDLLGLLVLAGHLAQPAAALGARPVGLIERVDDLDLGELALRARAMAGVRRPLGGARRAVVAVRALLGGRAEERPGARLELLPNRRQLELESGDRVPAPGARQLLGERGQPLVEAIELGALQEGHLPEALNVGLGLDPDHAGIR